MKKGLIGVGGLLIAMAPIMVLAATVFTLMLPNIYQSSARISVASNAPEINSFDGADHVCQAYDPYFLRTQFEMLTSKPVLYEVINRLNLQQKWGRGSDQLPREVTFRILRNSVQVFQQRDTSLIAINVKRDDPNEAADIANEVAATYRDSRLDLAMKNARGSLEKIDVALKEQANRVEAAEMKVETIRKDLGLVVFGEAEADLDDVMLQQLESDRLEAHAAMLEKKGLLDVMSRFEDEEIQKSASVFPTDSPMAGTLQELMMVEAELKVFEGEYGSDHPDVKKLVLKKQALDELLKKQYESLCRSVETEYLIAKNKYESLDETLEQARGKAVVSQDAKYRPYRKALADLESERFIYDQLKAKHRQEVVTLEVPRSPVKIIDIAEPNLRPVSPNLFLNVLLSVCVAAFFGLIGAVLLVLGLKVKKPIPVRG